MLNALLTWCGRSWPARFASRGPVCLLLHRVTSTQAEPWTPTHRLSVSSEWFEALVADAAARFRPMTLSAIVDHLEAGEPPPPDAVAISFDDGYVDLAHHVKPILERYQVPATAFISSTLASHEAIPFEFALERIITQRTELCDELTGQARRWPLNDPDQRRACYDTLSRALRPRSRREQLDTLGKIGKGIAAPTARELFLNWDQLRELRDGGLIELQTHGHEHLPLNTRQQNEVIRDLLTHRSVFENHLGQPPTLLAYPYGATSNDAAQLARAAGFRAAFTTRPGVIRREGDRFAIPRFELGAAATAERPNVQATINRKLAKAA